MDWTPGRSCHTRHRSVRTSCETDVSGHPDVRVCITSRAMSAVPADMARPDRGHRRADTHRPVRVSETQARHRSPACSRRREPGSIPARDSEPQRWRPCRRSQPEGPLPPESALPAATHPLPPPPAGQTRYRRPSRPRSTSGIASASRGIARTRFGGPMQPSAEARAMRLCGTGPPTRHRQAADRDRSRGPDAPGWNGHPGASIPPMAG